MSTQSIPPPPRVVFVAGVEAGPEALSAIDTAASLAKEIAGGELHLVHVVQEPLPRSTEAPVPLATPTAIIEAARATLDDAVARARATFGGPLVGHLAVGTAWREILQLATNLQADVIVVGTHGRKGVDRFLAGSVAEMVVRKAQCPVVVARPKDYHMKDVPEIEPPCPDCLAVQRETHGDKLWCARHGSAHSRARLHYEVPQAFGVGSMLIRPE